MTQINRWDSVFRAVTAPASRHRANAERTRQQRPRATDLARAHEIANPRARHRLAAHPHLRINHNLEPKLTPEFAQQTDIARSLVPESEIVTFMQLNCVQAVTQDLLNEITRAEQRQVSRERQQQHRVNSGLLQQPQLLRHRGQQLQPRIRTQYPHRMRLKSYHDRFHPTLL